MPAILTGATRWQWRLRQHEPPGKVPLPGLTVEQEHSSTWQYSFSFFFPPDLRYSLLKYTECSD